MNKPVRILLVEDSEDDAKLALRALRTGGFDVTHRRVQTAADLDTALEHESWDAVISDFRMPAFTGVDALRRVRSTGLDIPFILISGTIGEETAVDAMKAGATDYIMKKSLARLAPALERELSEAKNRAAHRQAQNDLRESEGLKRSILESSLDCIITMDDEGKIVEFNPAASAAFALTREQALGKEMVELIVPPRLRDAHRRGFAHYLATGQGPVLGKRMELEAIRADGTEFPIELTITTNGAKVAPMFTGFIRDITARKEAEDGLRRFSAAMDATADAIYLVDRPSMRIIHVNQAACRMRGKTRSELMALGPEVVLSISRAELERAYDELIASGVEAAPIEMLRIREDGSQVWVELRRHALRLGDRSTIVTLVRDVTARKESESSVRRLNRVYAMLSGINALIVRVRDREPLFGETCRIAVEDGGFSMAWIGTVDAARKIMPVASMGAPDEFLAAVTQRASMPDDVRPGVSLIAQAVREKKPTFSNDSQNDPQVTLRKEHGKHGSRSVAFLPLQVLDEVVGILALHSKEAGFFDEEELKLLSELAGNVSLALEHIEKAAKLERVTGMNAMLSDINGAIVRIRERHALFAEACRIAVQTGGLGFAWICLVDKAEQRCRPVAWAGNDDDGYLKVIRDRLSLRDDAPGGHGLTAMAVRERRAFVVNDIEADPTLLHRKEFAARGFRALVALPMIVAGRAIGSFTLHAAEPGFFDDEEMKLLTEVTGNIAFAIEHLEKEERVRRLTRVYAVLSAINSIIVRAVDRDQLFQEASRIAVELGGFRMAWIAILDKASGILKPIASAGEVGNFFDSAHLGAAHNQPGGMGLPGRAVREMTPMVANDVRTDPSILGKQKLDERGIHSAALVPLIVGQQGIGVLALYSADAGFFDEEEMRLLAELGGNIAFAVDHLDKQERLNYLAYYDALTGLPNRSLLLGRVTQGMQEAVVSGHKVVLLLIDLERFKSINDTLGRPAGDALLTQVAQWLTRTVGDASLLAHLGADHFAVVLPNVRREGALERLIERKLKAFLAHSFRLNEGTFQVAAKVGISVYPDDGANADTLFKHAEAALKKAKAGGYQHLFYTPDMTETVAGKLSLENQLRHALANGEFVLHYQPKINLASGRLTSVEALIRWNDPRTGLVPPGRFIPVLEETGLIHDVGRWALRQALADYLRWRAAGLAAVRVAVNVSPLQLRSRGFIAEVRQAIGIDPRAGAGLELEITESLIMEDVKHSIASLEAIRAMGVSVAIDDFGTGFSSLSYLARLPVDTLKIDRSFITDITKGPAGLALVSTIINLAHSLKLKVVAEGVETEQQSRLLRLLDCDEMQGFLVSKAIPSETLERLFLTVAETTLAAPITTRT